LPFPEREHYDQGENIMADFLTSAYNSVGTTKLGANYNKHVISTSDAGRELVIKVVKSGSGNLTDANLTSIRNAITQAGGSAGTLQSNQGDAFTVAAVGTADGSAFVSGTTTTVFMRVQGTGTFDTTDAAGATGATVTVEATFTPAL
jgi:hypothetical protein